MSYGHIDIYGSTISIDGTVIHGIDDDGIPFPEGSTGTKDVSTQDSGTVMEKGLQRFDPGSVELTGNIIPGDAGQAALWAAFTDRKAHTISVTIPDAGEVYTYQGLVSTFVPSNDDNTYKFSCTIEATGQPIRATTFAAITSIEGAGAGIAYSPATANTALGTSANIVIFKEATGITTDTVEVTAAAASAIAISYDDGATWTALTSGTPATFDADYWPAAGGLAEALIKVAEDNKATRFVKLYIARA